MTKKDFEELKIRIVKTSLDIICGSGEFTTGTGVDFGTGTGTGSGSNAAGGDVDLPWDN